MPMKANKSKIFSDLNIINNFNNLIHNLVKQIKNSYPNRIKIASENKNIANRMFL